MSTQVIDDVLFAGAAAQARRLSSGELSSVELVQECLRRIQWLDQELNCFRIVRYEAALKEAQAADGERGSAQNHKPLLGVPIAVKDDLHVSGEATGMGIAPGSERAVRDSEAIRRLRGAGAVIVGKTNVPELCAWPFTESSSWGETRNPWELGRTPGGSSGGSAAAVAAGLVGAALGSDGGGSIRIPAACCGVFGLKPQRGRIPLEPYQAWHGLTVLGPLARRVLDAAVLYDALAQRSRDGSAVDAVGTRPGRLRIAWSLKHPLPGRIGDDVRRGVEQTSALLARLGHRVDRRDPDYAGISYSHIAPYFAGICAGAEALARDRLEPRTRSVIRLGALCRPFVPAALRLAAAQARRLGRLFDDYDIVLTPVVPGPPPEVGRWRGRGALRTLIGVSRTWPPLTLPWNLTGQPAASVPVGFDALGLPLAVQLIGRPQEEAKLISVAAQLEAETAWADRKPGLSQRSLRAVRESR